MSLVEKYPEGTTVDCVVSRVEAFGVFVRLRDDEEVLGFIRPRDWSWSRRIFDITGDVEIGREVRAEVLGHTGKKKLELSRRKVLPDPFPAFVEKHKIGDTVLGQVTLVAKNDTGVVLTLDDGVEGFVPRSELPHTEEEGFGLLAQDWMAGRITGFQRNQVRLSVRELLHERSQKAANGADQSRSALRFHPSIGPGLENMRLNMELDEVALPNIDPLVREKVRRILVVEDSPNVSESLEMIFDHFEFPCDLVDNTDEALEKIRQQDYDLVLLDVNLPSGSGVDLVRRLQRPGEDGHGDAFLFVLTATRASDWSELIAEHADHRTCFFQKPTSVQRLFEQLARLVHGEAPADDDRSFRAGLDASGSPQVRVTPHSASLHVRIEQALDELRSATHADHAFVLAYRPGPSFELLGGTFPELTRAVQQDLEMSPVGDVVRQRRYVAVPDVAKQEKRFKHLLKILPAGSFAGIPLSYSDHSEYGLFLISNGAGELSAGEERLAGAAQLVGHAIAEERLDQVITENQGLLLTGFLSDSLLHEIKNEVQALDDYAAVQVLLGQRSKGLDTLKPNEALEMKRSILGIQSVAKRLGELIVLFRNLAGRPPDQTVDLNRAVERLQQTVHPFAETCDVRLGADLDPAIPPLKVNPKMIDQPLLNIMINGVEQLGRSGARDRRLTVSTRFDADADYPVTILISDNGRGIHHVHREKIFDLFFTTKESGTGLGLYISRFFVEQLGGRLRLARSVMFSGTEFAVELPKEALA